MSNHFESYRKAAERVRRGWAKGRFTDSRGNECLVQSILSAEQLRGEKLPDDMVAEIDAKLQHYWYYRKIRAALLNNGFPLQDAIIVWNDTPWRRQQQVVKVLDDLADSTEKQWLRDEHVRLTNEVSHLRHEVTELKKRVAELEEENSLLRRMTNSFTLWSDRRQLEELEDELSQTWEQLNALPALR